MNSMIFSDEEARFLRLVLNLAERPLDDNKTSWMGNGLHTAEKMAKVSGEFRVLVIGGRGVGKTSLLTKFCTDVFPDPSTLRSSSYLHGCRHTLTIDSRVYMVDALELPADHLASSAHLAQALAITDAAVLVYDITDLASLTYLKSLSSTIYDAIHRPETGSPTKKRNGFFTSSPTMKDTPSAGMQKATRPYHFLLLGAKNDVSPEVRDVSWLEGQNAATEFFGPTGVAGGTSASFMEVSAQSGENVGAMFPLLGREILQSRRERKEYCSQQYHHQQQQQQKRYVAERGAFAGWDCSDFDIDDDEEDGDTDECECADAGGALVGSVRRRWCTLKATLAGSIFKK